MKIAVQGRRSFGFNHGFGMGMGAATPYAGAGGATVPVAGAPAGCPLLSNGNCGTADAQYPCSEVRECDPVDGAVHYEYTLPSGPVLNANVWSVNADGSYIWLGPNGTPATPPIGEAPPNTNISVPTDTANWFATWQKQQAALTAGAAPKIPPVTTYTAPPPPPTPPPPTPPPPTTPPATTNTGGTGNGSTNTGGNGGSTLISGVSDTYVYIGLAVVAFFMLKGK